MIEVAERAALARDAHAGFAARGGGPRRQHARAALARVLWTRTGQRRLPGAAALDAALSVVAPEDLYWMCELAPLGPLYFLPTRRFVAALATELRALGASRVLEVGAGDGFLSRSLCRAAPELRVVASDSGAWQRPLARMNAADRKEHRGRTVPGLTLGVEVHRVAALPAIARYRPDVVLAVWLPPGPLLDRLIRSPVPYVLEIGAPGGVTAGPWSWRFAHDFLDGPLETWARCRLDARPAAALHSRVTLYYGARHPEHAVQRVRRDDWLWQFKPVTRRAGAGQR